MSHLREQIRERVAQIAGIGVLVLFGSRARRQDRPDSDLDLAVLPEPDPDRDDEALFRHRLQKRLAVALADLVPRGRVDVLFLDEAPDTLRQRVMEQGQMVLCRTPDAWKALRVRTMKEYGDREWARNLYRRKLRRRLLEGGSSGRSARTRQPLERARRLSGEA